MKIFTIFITPYVSAIHVIVTIVLIFACAVVPPVSFGTSVPHPRIVVIIIPIRMIIVVIVAIVLVSVVKVLVFVVFNFIYRIRGM